MAGTIIADKIQTENSFLTLNVGQTLVATINSSGILNSSGGTMISANGAVSNTAITGLVTAAQIATVANTQITGLVTAAQIATVANTQITGNITSSQITSNPTFYGNVSVTGAIGVGGATPTSNGSGITFPATQSASSDVNTLDDYEEGTWTPSIGGTATYSGTQNGVYTKVGRVVNISFDITINVLGTGSTTTLSGLPFAQSGGVVRSGITIAYYVTLNVSTISIVGVCDGGSSMFFSGSAASATGITDSLALFKAGARIIGSGTYITAT